ncbi:MAG: 3'-5' exonuclease [Rhodomicrobium sp.]
MLGQTLRRLFYQASIGDQSYRFLFRPPPTGEAVSIDCETTGLNIAKDDIITIAAVRIKGDRILSSEAFEVLVRPETKIAPDAMKIHHLREADVEQEQPIRKVLRDFLYFIGSRPLVGYYLEFDIKMLDKHILPFIQIGLPNKRIEVSELYYERKYGNAPPGTSIDLHFTSILEDLGLPNLGQHNALNDALMTAMIYVVLRDMRNRGARVLRERTRPFHDHAMGA